MEYENRDEIKNETANRMAGGPPGQRQPLAALPQAFVERMQHMLKSEYPAFIDSYEKTRVYGLRFNPLKTNRDGFLERMPFSLEPVPWAKEGFYYKEEERPGRHAFHEAGAYYIQEPSAMAVVEVLSPERGERILDLCAAPGGKSTQIAGKMLGEGLLVSNEIISGRAKILSQNIERMGIPNAVVCNETPERIAEMFPQFFDRVLVDAPCSGEGMFRKDETAVNEWSPEHVSMCAQRQRMILEQAAQTVKAGGVLVYSTCTFSPQENETVISAFLQEHKEFSIEESEAARFFEPGRSEWIEASGKAQISMPTGERGCGTAKESVTGYRCDIGHTMRLWPHKIEGEGHFIARLRKDGGLCTQPPYTAARTGCKDAIRLCMDFLKKELGVSDMVIKRLEEGGVFSLFGEHVYVIPKQMIPLKGIKVLRPGLHIGTLKKNRFEPSHALALYLSPEAVSKTYEMTQQEVSSYLRGETFACAETLRGWVLLTFGAYPAGFGKAGGGQMKNHYPKGLRKL